MSSQFRSISNFSSHERPTVGDTKASVISEDHMGWIKCDGRSLKVSDFYFLFQVIQYSFGGSGPYFNIPNAGGLVPGFVGTGIDINSNTKNFILGQQVGEYQHKLTIPEIPSHNHGVAGTNQVMDQVSSNVSTSLNSTGISVNVSTTGVYDSGHTHSYTTTNDTNHDNAISATNSANNQGTHAATTGTGNASIVDPGHRHAITDPTHSHSLHPAGGDQYHNIVQPTLPIGNMFIYTGKVNYGTFPNIRNVYSFY